MDTEAVSLDDGGICRGPQNQGAAQSLHPQTLKTRVPDSLNVTAVEQGPQKHHQLSPELHSSVTETIAKKSLCIFSIPAAFIPWLTSVQTECITLLFILHSFVFLLGVPNLLHAIKSPFSEVSMVVWQSLNL